MRPKISVVIPVYNRAHSVLPTLQSVQAQTFRDFECIIVDDGSKDGEELRRLVEGLDDARFRYVRRVNGGGGAARNTGIDEAKGSIIALLDSDDRWLPEKLARDVEAGAAEQVVFSPVMVERGRRIVGQRPKSAPRPGEPMGDYLACRQGFVPTSTLALPSAIASNVKYNDALLFGDDTDFAIRLAEQRIEFKMCDSASAVVCDDESADRLSRSTDWVGTLAWLDSIRGSLSNRAYYAYRGWHVARLAAFSGQYRVSLNFYFDALFRGAFSPPLAVKAIAQLLIPSSWHSRFRA